MPQQLLGCVLGSQSLADVVQAHANASGASPEVQQQALDLLDSMQKHERAKVRWLVTQYDPAFVGELERQQRQDASMQAIIVDLKAAAAQAEESGARDAAHTFACAAEGLERGSPAFYASARAPALEEALRLAGEEACAYRVKAVLHLDATCARLGGSCLLALNTAQAAWFANMAGMAIRQLASAAGESPGRQLLHRALSQHFKGMQREAAAVAAPGVPPVIDLLASLLEALPTADLPRGREAPPKFAEAVAAVLTAQTGGGKAAAAAKFQEQAWPLMAGALWLLDWTLQRLMRSAAKLGLSACANFCQLAPSAQQAVRQTLQLHSSCKDMLLQAERAGALEGGTSAGAGRTVKRGKLFKARVACFLGICLSPAEVGAIEAVPADLQRFNILSYTDASMRLLQQARGEEGVGVEAPAPAPAQLQEMAQQIMRHMDKCTVLVIKTIRGIPLSEEEEAEEQEMMGGGSGASGNVSMTPRQAEEALREVQERVQDASQGGALEGCASAKLDAAGLARMLQVLKLECDGAGGSC